MKVLSLFSGIGAFEKALDKLGVPYELAGYCEIDKYASKSYSAIHGVPESLNLGDITKIDEKQLPHDLDLITYGFPCQDISNAGKQKGLYNEDGSLTRSGLFFEALRIIEETKPRVAIAENVKNLTGKRFAEQFKTVLESLEEAGYNNYWKVLNLKDFGVPQNRERVFIISIRKGIDNGLFRFPEGFPLTIRLKDVLEPEVDERFYLSDKAIAGLDRRKMENQKKGNGFGWNPTTGDGIATTLSTSSGTKMTDNYIACEEKVISVGNVNPSGHGMNGNVISENGLSSTLTTNKGEGLKILVSGEPNVLTPKRTEYGKAIRKAYEAGEVEESRRNMTEMVPRTDGICNTLTTVLKDNYVAVAMRGRYNEDGKVEQQIEISGREYANTITSVQKDSMVANVKDAKAEPTVRQIGNCCPTKTRDNPNQGRIYDTDGLAPALNCMGGGNRQPFVPVSNKK